MTTKLARKRRSIPARGFKHAERVASDGGGSQLIVNEITRIVPELAQSYSGLAVIQTRVLGQSSQTRKRLLNRCQFVLENPHLNSAQELRVMAAKVLAACLPESTEVLRRLIRTFNTAGSYDVHFSLFVFLADVKQLDARGGAAAIARDLMGQYLTDVPASTGHAAFMAGHALGGHLQDVKTVRMLANLVTNARYASGRAAAIGGLAESLGKKDRRANKTFRRYLVRSAKTDRSSGVRAAARLALGKRYRHLRHVD